ncbi:MAG: hypothetical protein R3C28_28070 [Pirellulaceae bacterium]
MMAKLEIPTELLPTLGMLEIAVVILFLIRGVLGVLTTGYLGGAVWAHLRVGDAWFFPIIIGVLMWLGLALRRPSIFKLVTSSTDAWRDTSSG